MVHTETVATLFELAIADAVADDETKHARTLANIRDSLPPNVLSSKEDPVQVRKAREVLKAVTDNDLDSITTLEDAYQLSHKLENSGVNMIFTLLVEQFAPSDGRLSFVLPAIEIHLARLKSFSRIPDSAIWRKGILAKSAHHPVSGCAGNVQSWFDVREQQESAQRYR